jgi:hypothetical protein
MSVYAGIDVHRKRSQVAVVDHRCQAKADPGTTGERQLRRKGGPPSGISPGGAEDLRNRHNKQ